MYVEISCPFFLNFFECCLTLLYIIQCVVYAVIRIDTPVFFVRFLFIYLFFYIDGVSVYIYNLEFVTF